MNKFFCTLIALTVLTTLACITPNVQVVQAQEGDAAALPEYKPTPLDDDPNLMGWWKFDETSGKKAADSSKQGRDGALLGELSFKENSAPGRFGNALKMTGGEENYVQITGYKGIAGTGARTVSCFTKTTEQEGDFVSWGKEEGGQMFLFTHIRERMGCTPQGGYLYAKDYTNDDKWHHMAVVVEEAELPNLYDHVKLYLDGEEATIDDIGVLDLWPINNATELDVRIGFRYAGLIDDVRIFDRPLSIDEIKLLAQQPQRQRRRR